MRKILLTIAATIALSTTAQAADFQKIYMIDYKASNIVTAAGNVDQNIYCSNWGVTLKFQGEVKIEAKDGKYRLTFDKMRSIDSGVLLADLPQTQKSCNKAMEAYGEDLHKKISKWSDF
jgi:hypothetical protein